MKKGFFIVLAVFLYFSFNGCGDKKSTTINPGYDKAELTALMPVMERVYDSSDIGGFKTPEPVKVKRVFRSKVSPLMNRFDVWLTDDKKAVIPIRGTIVDTAALSFSVAFYAHMVAANGKIKMSDNKYFEYKLAELPGATVHIGILVALGLISDELLAQINKQYADGVRDFIILGHSQGSGIAFLATSYIRYLQKDGKLPADFKLKTYCIAAPKVGNLDFAYDYEKLNSNWSITVNNVIDWVPYIGITMQTSQDFPKISPFHDVKGFLKDVNYAPGDKFDEGYKKFVNVVPDAITELNTVIHQFVYPRIVKAMPGYVEPELMKNADFERIGPTVPLIPGAEYHKLFPNDPAKFQVWENHSVYPYYILVKTN